MGGYLIKTWPTVTQNIKRNLPTFSAVNPPTRAADRTGGDQPGRRTESQDARGPGPTAAVSHCRLDAAQRCPDSRAIGMQSSSDAPVERCTVDAGDSHLGKEGR